MAADVTHLGRHPSDLRAAGTASPDVGFAEITTDPAFDAIRNAPAFMAYLRGLKIT